MSEELTKEDIADRYKSTMDSVNLILNGKPLEMSDLEWADTVRRNKRHLQIMLDKDFWTTEDLTPFQNAIDFVEV
jgi:hypothetical protein